MDPTLFDRLRDKQDREAIGDINNVFWILHTVDPEARKFLNIKNMALQTLVGTRVNDIKGISTSCFGGVGDTPFLGHIVVQYTPLLSEEQKTIDATFVYRYLEEFVQDLRGVHGQVYQRTQYEKRTYSIAELKAKLSLQPPANK